ncbi:regulatory protein, luxR family [Microterricola viridarii]|uniref:Regulatory protein, luxR family n=1 Tax=Microterricola viridarii TaxID=412690 RepID=A0A1H1N8K3_9MICO|nr:regulatory protein, luxR family [Microterricola viridarii]
MRKTEAGSPPTTEGALLSRTATISRQAASPDAHPLLQGAVQPDGTALLEGSEQLVIVRALPGMGKTRSVDAWRALCEERGVQTTIASARELRMPLAELVAEAAATASGLAHTLVIDDAELLTAPQLGQLYAQLQVEPGLRAVLCTSCAAAADAPALPAGLTVREVGAAQLKLTVRQNPDARHDADASPSALAAQLLQAADGWPGLMIRLADAAPAGGTELESAGAEDAAAAVALAVGTPAVAQWLRAAVERALGDGELLSIARRMALAPQLLERHIALLGLEGDAVVGTLNTLGFFVQSGAAGAPGARQMVPAIRALLRDDARTHSPTEFREWNRVFADGLVSHGGRDEIWVALEHARAAEAWDILASLWARHGLGLLNRNFTVAVGAYSDLPDGAIREYPELRLAQLVLMSLDAAGSAPGATTGSTTGGVWLRASTQAATPLLPQLSDSTTADGLIGVMSAVLVNQRVTGAVAGALESSRLLAEQLDQRAALGEQPSASNYAWARFQHAVTLLLADDLPGSLAAATDSYEWAVGAGIDAEHVVVNAAAHLALCHALSGAEEDALDWLDVAGPHDPSQWHGTLTRVPAQVAAACVATERLDRAAAELALAATGDGSAPIEMWPFVAAQAARSALTFGDPTVMLAEFDRVELAQARLGRTGSNGALLMMARTRADGLIATGAAGRAVELLEMVAHRVCAAKPDAVPELLVSYARAHLYGGRAAQAARLASTAVNSRRTTPTDGVEASLILAEALLRQGEEAAAVEAFTHAHTLAVHRRQWRVFLGIPRESLARLSAASGATLPAVAAERLAGLNPLFPESEQIAELTARELVVLDGLRSGGSTAEVAAALSVSPNTVKSQISSIFAKLGVRDRERALSVAERRGLLRRRP